MKKVSGWWRTRRAGSVYQGGRSLEEAQISVCNGKYGLEGGHTDAEYEEVDCNDDALAAPGVSARARSSTGRREPYTLMGKNWPTPPSTMKIPTAKLTKRLQRIGQS